MQKTLRQKIELIVSFILVLGILITPFFLHKQNSSLFSKLNLNHNISIGNTNLHVAYADTDPLRVQGLSGSAPLKSDEGMLFFFDTPTQPGFWMKDMNYPIDIIWIDANRKIVGVSADLDPKTYPMNFYPPSPVKYALEVSAEFYQHNNLQIGDELVM